MRRVRTPPEKVRIARAIRTRARNRPEPIGADSRDTCRATAGLSVKPGIFAQIGNASCRIPPWTPRHDAAQVVSTHARARCRILLAFTTTLLPMGALALARQGLALDLAVWFSLAFIFGVVPLIDVLCGGERGNWATPERAPG